MKYTFTLPKNAALTMLFMVSCFSLCQAQKLLNKRISVTVNRQPVSEVLQTIGKQGGFYFSYDSNVVPGDSVVTFTMRDESVKQVLDALLKGKYQYKETGDYIILQRAQEEKFFYITGSIHDEETGKVVDYASVYSKSYLISTWSEDDGSFRLKLKERTFPFTLTISKVGYADTIMVVESGFRSNLKIRLKPRAIDLDEVNVYNSAGDRTWLAKLFVSSRLRAQSRNIGRFFVSLPYQASLAPGLGTHGRMSSQITNKFSLNLFGGYTAGVNGLEMAGCFNISKKDVRYVQLAGMFNVVSGNVKGVQLAGLHNHVLDSLVGVQASGFGSIVGKNVRGIQASGCFNQVSGTFSGVQLAGAANLNRKNSKGLEVSGIINRAAENYDGVQLAGGLNMVRKNLNGVQIAGIGNAGRGQVGGLQLSPFNYAKMLKGVQIGIVNIADSSSGYSIGILNIIKNGKGNITVFANDIVPLNIAWKTGTRKIYSILTAGTAIDPGHKAYTFGIGLGKEFRLNNHLGLMAEVMSQNIYLGSWKDISGMNRLQTALDLKLSKRLTLSAGPSFSVMEDKQIDSRAGYRQLPPKGLARFSMGSSLRGLVGWQAGISWNYNAVF
jgi:hypothetical protein